MDVKVEGLVLPGSPQVLKAKFSQDHVRISYIIFTLIPSTLGDITLQWGKYEVSDDAQT